MTNKFMWYRMVRDVGEDAVGLSKPYNSYKEALVASVMSDCGYHDKGILKVSLQPIAGGYEIYNTEIEPSFKAHRNEVLEVLSIAEKYPTGINGQKRKKNNAE